MLAMNKVALIFECGRLSHIFLQIIEITEFGANLEEIKKKRSNAPSRSDSFGGFRLDHVDVNPSENKTIFCSFTSIWSHLTFCNTRNAKRLGKFRKFDFRFRPNFVVQPTSENFFGRERLFHFFSILSSLKRTVCHCVLNQKRFFPLCLVFFLSLNKLKIGKSEKLKNIKKETRVDAMRYRKFSAYSLQNGLSLIAIGKYLKDSFA